MPKVESFTDYYGILGVPRYTDEKGIRRAYLRRARQYHPDLHPDVPEAGSTMSSINAAYATLSDPALRARYDERRSETHSAGTTAHPGSLHISVTRRGSRGKSEPSVAGITLALFVRLFRYVTAILPI